MVNAKKIAIIAAVLIILIISGFLSYRFLLKKTPTPPSTLSTSTSTDQLISQAISQEAVTSPIVINDKVRYFSANNGYVFESKLDGSQKIRLSARVWNGFFRGLWSPDKKQAIIFTEKDGQIDKFFYNYQKQEIKPLSGKISSLAWSPQGDKIAYQYYDPEKEINNISIANPDGSQWYNIVSIIMKNLIIEWPQQEKIILRTKPSGLAQSIVYALNPASSQLEKIFGPSYGLTIIWSPLGDKFLASETDQYGKNLKLKIIDLIRSTVKELDLVTLPEKCTWSQDNRTIFCAIPRSLPMTAHWPDDYYKGLMTFNDDFWQINLDTGQAVQILKRQTQESNYDARHLLLSPLEDYLLFVNQKDGLLYSLAL